jgi:hypothetical protein
MNFKTVAIAAAFFFSTAAMADEAIRFVPENYPIGVLNQGAVKHIVLNGPNTTGSEIVL